MPRNIEFDVEQSVDRATHIFWDQGYENTSLDDLLKSMQISPGSFYNKFQSKKRLYRICLDHYNEKFTSRRTTLLLDENRPVQQAVRAFFRLVIQEIARSKGPKGCLMTNSLCAEVLSEDDLSKYVLGGMRELTAKIRARLTEAVRTEELPAEFDAATTADLLISWIQGLNKGAQMGKSSRQLQKETDLLLAGLGL